MSADAITLVLVVGVTLATIMQRVSAQIVILVLMSSFLMSLTFGADIVNFLGNYNELFGTQNMRLALYLLLAGLPTILTYRHMLGGANYGALEKFVVAVFLSLLLLIVIRNLFELAGLENPLRNSFFANQINHYEGLIIFTAFNVALFEVLNQNNPLGIKAKRGRRKRGAHKN